MDAARPGGMRNGDDPSMGAVPVGEGERERQKIGVGTTGGGDRKIGNEETADARHGLRTGAPQHEIVARMRVSGARDGEPGGDAVEQRSVSGAVAPLGPSGRHLEPERGERAHAPLGGEHEQGRAASLGCAGEANPSREAPGDLRTDEVENDEREAPGREQQVGGAQRVVRITRADPEDVREQEAGGGRGLGVERVVRVDPGDDGAGARGGRGDGAREAGATGAVRPGELGDAAARQPAAEQHVERGDSRRDRRGRRAGVGRPEENVPGTAQVVEEVGGVVHWEQFSLFLRFCQCRRLGRYLVPMPVEFWFEFASTYSYPAAMRVEALAARYGVPLVWRAFLLGPIFRAQGWNDSPFNLYPAKGRYMWRDLERICGADGLPFRRPAVFPQNGLLAARIACWFADEPWLPAFVRAVYVANFGDGRDISDPAVLAACLAEAGEAASPVLDRIKEDDAKAKLRVRTDEAVRHGIFGAPSVRVGAELFWGNDRLEAAFRWRGNAVADPAGDR
jgi:2-hydroxychromene-2-carboxylate isomerase